MTDNPALAVIIEELGSKWASRSILDALLASPEALRWLGQHVDPEALGYEVSKRWTAEPVYLAPRREEEPEDA